MSEQLSNENKCIALLKNCLSIIFPSIQQVGVIQEEKGVIKKEKAKGLKYQRIKNPNEDDEDDEEDVDEESKTTAIGEGISTGSNEDQAQFFNEFSSWRSKQNKDHTSNDRQKNQKQTEMIEMNKSPKRPPSMLSLSENEIEKQKNTISDGTDDLFKAFNDNKPKQTLPKPQAVQQKTQPQNLNNFFNDLANKQQQQAFAQQTVFAGASDQQNQNKDILEEKGWDDEININIE